MWLYLTYIHGHHEQFATSFGRLSREDGREADLRDSALQHLTDYCILSERKLGAFRKVFAMTDSNHNNMLEGLEVRRALCGGEVVRACVCVCVCVGDV